MKTYKFFSLVAILALVIAALPVISAGAGGPITINKGNVALSGGFQAGNFPEVWDLTAGDMTLSFTYDGNGLVDDFGGSAHAWTELGIRDKTTTSNFNPNNKGIWLATDYDWNANTFNPDPVGFPSLDLDDKLILQKVSGQGEGAYDLPSTPPAPGNNHRVWWDRDGVDPWQNGQTANTGGIYEIVITLHATSATSGTAYMTIKGLSQGFETDGNWSTIELTPAGMIFSGDMTHMQVFYGIYGYGATHSVNFNDITVTGVLNEPPTVDAGGPYKVAEGGSVTLAATGTDPENGPLTYAWDLDNNGTFETPGQSVIFDASALTAPNSYQVNVQVMDDAGQTAVDSATVYIIYTFTGFFPPVDNLPIFNMVKAGSAIPLKFSLNGYKGLDIFAAGYPRSIKIACDTGAPQDAIELTVTAGASSLSYNEINDQYNYVWKTEKSWAGTCRMVTVMLIDGESFSANFKFK